MALGAYAIYGTARGIAFGIAIASCTGLASAQAPASAAPAAKPGAFTGCVQKEPGTSNLVISTPNVCARLTGKSATEKLVGHEIDLHGILVPRTASTAASIQVESVTKVGKSCTDVCALQPPGTRSLHPKDHEVPGSEGGTPGLTAPPKPQ
ncbi:MAG TPA: hypothetical protein VF865_02285 [Acidobacteriaceae bacterium]